MQKILNKIKECGGKPFFCGGYVRDHILGIESKDIDIEVFGIKAEELLNILSGFGEVDLVGKSFGVIKLKYNGVDYDFSLPRRETPTGIGHKDFLVEPDPTMSLKDAAGRRNFTFNAIYMDDEGNITDPYNGALDLKLGVLRATTEHYKEDSLRVLIGVQLCSRFNLKAEEKTIYLSRLMLDDAGFLPAQRLKTEWFKWTAGSYPAAGLDFLEQTGHIQQYQFFDKLQYTPQDPIYHPEGYSITEQKGVWSHTKHVCQAMAEICDRENIQGSHRALLLFSALLHDCGKPYTTFIKNGRWVSPGHDKAGVDIAELFMERYIESYSLSKKVQKLVSEHMAHFVWKNVKKKEKFVRKLASRLSPASIEDLALLIEADMSGRPPLPKGMPDSVVEIRETARKLGVNEQPEKPKVRGQDLIDLGYNPGKHFREILDFAYTIQMNGYDKDKTLRQVKGRYNDR